MRSIFNLFAKSPFGPTQAHLKKAVECAQQLRPLFEAVCAEDDTEIQRVTDFINQLEHETDQIKNEIRNHLPKSLFLPIDRRDLLELIHMQDSIADSTQEVAGMLTLKKLRLPEDLKPNAMELIDEILVTCDMAATIGFEMDELTETSFGGPEADKVLDMINQLDDSETKSDVIGVRLARQLFALEDQMSPVDVMLWYQVFYTAGQVANYAERMGNRLRLLIARA
ncbi:MAG: TIGR00153 family protein [Candidatus Poribacteria bacterium]|nr:TIGR00153 family protein [Candidatus Poribacteria bacterium]